MSFFDQAYDDMSWLEVCYRLPSELAVNALIRRVNNLDTLRMFFDGVGKQPNSITVLKDHVNSILNSEEPDDIFEVFDKKYEKVLFDWLDDNNKGRLKDHDPDQLGTKFLFNATQPDDNVGLQVLMDRVLGENEINTSHLNRVLNKADSQYLSPLLDQILKDSRPEVRVCVLGVAGLTNKSLLSDHHRVIGLKALAKCQSHAPIGSMSLLNIDVFSSLRPGERLVALEKYFGYFPKYKKISAFSPAPSQDEFDLILFAGCIEHNDLIIKLNETYKQITEMDPPKEDDEEE